MDISQKKEIATNWFQKLRDEICSQFQLLEVNYNRKNSDHIIDPKKCHFNRSKWQRDQDGSDGGYGEISIMKGNLFEKVGVNFQESMANLAMNLNRKFQELVMIQTSGLVVFLLLHICNLLLYQQST